MTIIKDTPDSSCFFQSNSELAQIAAGPNSMTSTTGSGNFINGPLSLSSTVDKIRIGGIFRPNPALSTCIPSTMVTPIPTLIIDLPVKNLASMVAVAAMVASIM